MTYEYLCQACGHEWEAEQAISEAPLKRCPACSKHKAKRQVSGGGGFILKGGGWYADGYGNKQPAGKSNKKDQSPEGETKKSDAKGDGKKSEAKSKDQDSVGKSKKKDKGTAAA